MNGDASAIKLVNAVALQQAVLCANCDSISDSPHDTCMICGSRSLLPLSRILGDARGEVPSGAAGTVHPAAVERPASDKIFVLTPAPHGPRRRRG
jgi:hypothetical protein